MAKKKPVKSAKRPVKKAAATSKRKRTAAKKPAAKKSAAKKSAAKKPARRAAPRARGAGDGVITRIKLNNGYSKVVTAFVYVNGAGCAGTVASPAFSNGFSGSPVPFTGTNIQSIAFETNDVAPTTTTWTWQNAGTQSAVPQSFVVTLDAACNASITAFQGPNCSGPTIGGQTTTSR